MAWDEEGGGGVQAGRIEWQGWMEDAPSDGVGEEMDVLGRVLRWGLRPALPVSPQPFCAAHAPQGHVLSVFRDGAFGDDWD